MAILKYKTEDQPWYSSIPPIEDKGIGALNEAPFDVILLTAVKFERDAVLRLLSPLPGQQAIWRARIDKETYYLGQFGNYKTVVTMCEMGTTGRGSSILATYEAINLWIPRVVVMVGFAYGKDSEKQKIADILVSSQVINLGPKRRGKKTIYRGARVEPGPTLLNRFRDAMGWQFKRPDGSQCDIIIGPILSEEDLIDNLDHKKSLLEQFPDAIGGEMEGAGVYAAADRQRIEWIIIKGICDWADGNKDKEHQPLAAAAAVSLVHFVLSEPDVLPARGIVIDETAPKSSSLYRIVNSEGTSNLEMTIEESSTKGTIIDAEVEDYIDKQLPEPDGLATIREACYSQTKHIAKILIDNRPVISRHGFRTKLNDFLSSSSRYCVVLGPSGVGKSVTMAVEALRIFDLRWLSLLMTADSFSIDRAYRSICEEMLTKCSAATFRQFIKPLTEQEVSDTRGLVIFIDAIDDTNPDRIASELSKLHETIGDLPAERLKVVVSCRDTSWEGLKNHPSMPIYQQATQFGRLGTASYLSIELSDFSRVELDSALEEIGADELLIAGQVEKQGDYHVQSLRELLTHPARFSHYANLKSAANLSLIQDLTWSRLIERSVNELLKKPARRCRVLAEELGEQLIRFAVRGWERKAWSFTLETSIIKNSQPDIFTRQPEADITPYAALLEAGILVETKTPDGHSNTAFRVTDVGAYFLSIEMERRLSGKPIAEFRKIAEEWLQEASNYSPLLDAVLAWVDRLADKPSDPRLLNLIELIISAYHFHRRSLFSLVRPAVVASIFEIVKRQDLEDFYAFREAARGVRYSAEAMRIIRHHLKDPNTEVRQLATELVGIHGDIESQEELLNLFADSDKDVLSEVYGAFRRFGTRAIEILIEVAIDASRPYELRAHCLGALRGVGYRDDRISALIRRCISNAESGNSDLLKAAFLLAAHMRDKGHTKAATAALRHESLDVVHAAAKYLVEVPDPKAFDKLEEALHPRWLPSGEIVNRYWVPRQLIAALMKTDRQKAEPIILEIMCGAFKGEGEFSPVEAVWSAKKLRSPALYVLAFEHFVSQLADTPERNIIFQATDTVGNVWREKELNTLIAVSTDLTVRGVEMAKLFVDAVAEGMEISQGYPLANQLSRVSDLRTAVKGWAPNLIPEAAQLLKGAKRWNLRELCDYFWVAGDERVEQSLLNRLENPISQDDTRWYEKSSLAKALGTCATKRGRDAILELLRSEENISAYFYQEALYPLAVRKVICPVDLAAVVRDAGYLDAGRTLSLLTLALLNVRRHKGLFIEVAGYSENKLLQEHGARLLGFTDDPSVAPTLIQLLRTSKHQSVKSEAAEALGRLRTRQAIYDIEHALQESPARGFISALARFQESSSLPLILEGIERGRGELYDDYLKALGAFWKFTEGREAIGAEIAKWARSKPGLFDEQTPVVIGLLQHQPGALLVQTSWLLDNGCLTSNARAQLARWIPLLAKNKEVDKKALTQMVKRLVCDRDITVRELTIRSLYQVDTKFCRHIYAEITKSAPSQEWDRACAVHVVAICGRDIKQVESARYDREFLVRRAADEALAGYHKKTELQQHIEQFITSDGLARLSAYLCLEEQGDLFSIASLDKKCRAGSLSFTFLRSLTSEISKRLEKEYKERQEKEDNLEQSRGTIWFD